MVEGDALDAGEGVTGLGAGQGAAGALGGFDHDGYLDAAGYRVAQCFGQRRVGAPGRLYGEGRDAADDNGPIAAE